MTDYDDVLWRWFLIRASVHQVYGWGVLDPVTRKHLLDCGIDHEFSDGPTVGTVSEFAGTFNDNDEIEAVVAKKWRCRCGEYSTDWMKSRWDHHDTLAIHGGKLLSEIIQGVVEEAMRQDKPETEEEMAARRRNLALERNDSHVCAHYVRCADPRCYEWVHNGEFTKVKDIQRHPWEVAQERGWVLAFQGPQYSLMETALLCPAHQK